MKTTTEPFRNSINSALTTGQFLLVIVTLACLTLLPTPKASGVSPAPDGGYPGNNTAEGEEALFSNTTGNTNAAIGFDALRSNTDGDANTAVGAFALPSKATGNNNTAIGSSALFENMTGSGNTAVGSQALYFNVASNNTATGYGSLYSNTTGDGNTASGNFALYTNSTGIQIGEACRKIGVGNSSGDELEVIP